MSSTYAFQVLPLEISSSGSVAASCGNTQPFPAAWPWSPSVPGSMSLKVVQLAATSGFGPCPLISAISLASSPWATA